MTTNTKKGARSGYAFAGKGGPTAIRYSSLQKIRNAYAKDGTTAVRKIVYVNQYGSVKPVGWVWRTKGVLWWARYGNGSFGSTPAHSFARDGRLSSAGDPLEL